MHLEEQNHTLTQLYNKSGINYGNNIRRNQNDSICKSSDEMVNLLILYNSSQTYTDTVYQHISALGKYTRYRAFFAHHDQWTACEIDLSRFEAIAIHYSVRLPYDQISPAWIDTLAKFSGCKVLFIQDEYDNTYRSWHWIKKLGFELVFSVVPKASITTVYPRSEFPSTRFVSVLTGYVPDALPMSCDVVQPSQRSLMIGYRGRPLPIRYGKLGQDKIAVGAMVRQWCESNDIKCDIAWSEEARIYGPAWFRFIAGCRATLGSESGCNVFDWNGDLEQQIKTYRRKLPKASEQDVYNSLIAPLEKHGLMNQISPRVFESIALRSVLVLLEGNYSGILEPNRHYIPLKRDGSNLSTVFAQLQDNELVDNLAERTYEEIIGSGKYSYSTFVQLVDEEVEKQLHK